MGILRGRWCARAKRRELCVEGRGRGRKEGNFTSKGAGEDEKKGTLRRRAGARTKRRELYVEGAGEDEKKGTLRRRVRARTKRRELYVERRARGRKDARITGMHPETHRWTKSDHRTST